MREVAVFNSAGEHLLALNDPSWETETDWDGGVEVAKRFAQIMPDGLCQLWFAMDGSPAQDVFVRVFHWLSLRELRKFGQIAVVRSSATSNTFVLE